MYEILAATLLASTLESSTNSLHFIDSYHLETNRPITRDNQIPEDIVTSMCYNSKRKGRTTYRWSLHTAIIVLNVDRAVKGRLLIISCILGYVDYYLYCKISNVLVKLNLAHLEGKQKK